MFQRILYAGDSTVTFNKISTYPQTGLSQGLLLYLKDDVFLRSYAVNGRSTKSFIDEGRLAEIDRSLEPDDFLFLQFGHNDEKKEDPLRYADPYGAYKENLKIMIDTARKHGAHPVLITPVARRLFSADGQFLPGSHGEYPEAMRQTGKEEGVCCIDLNTKSENYLASIGDYASRPMYVFPKDNSHMTYFGAAVMAGFLADGLLELGSPYSDLLIPRDYQKTDDNARKAQAPFMVLRECEDGKEKERTERGAVGKDVRDGNVNAAVKCAFQDEKNE